MQMSNSRALLTESPRITISSEKATSITFHDTERHVLDLAKMKYAPQGSTPESVKACRRLA
jgi:hypothetical protein